MPEPDSRTRPKRRRRRDGTATPGRPGGFDINSMMKQAQQMQTEMAEAQEKLKDETVEASAGGGMVKVKMSGDMRLLELTIDPDAVDPEDAEMLSGHGSRRGQRGRFARPRSWRRRRWATSPDSAAAWRARRSRPARHVEPRACIRSRSTSSSPSWRSSRDRPPHGAAPCIPHPALRGRRRRGARHRDPRRQGEGRALQVCFNLAEGELLRGLLGHPPRPHPGLRRRAARRRDPDRAHPRVPRPLPRARRRAVADRRHRPRGPEDPRARRPRSTGPRVGRRGRPRDQPDHDRRGDSSPHRRAAARQGSITRLASGLPVGADLEHADEVTLGRAFSGRSAVG